MKNEDKKIRVRFAPSPTGTLHTGSVRTALFNYLYAKQHQGSFIVRIDDTDKERSKPEYEKDILDGLAWLGLKPDELFYQSARTQIYKQWLTKLLEENKIYLSKEKVEEQAETGESAKKRAEVIRFRNPNKKVSFDDLIKGKIEFDTTELGDFVVAKDLDTPLYHFASVVDDYELGITHIIRGEDHLSNTPRQILIGEALSIEQPIFAHLPMILAPDKTKLSKRKHAEIASLNGLIKEGYLSEAIINFIAFLGWNPDTEQELFALEELTKAFDLTKVQKSNAIFNKQKLNWYNREYLKKLPSDEIILKIKEFFPKANDKIAEKLIPEIINRVNTWGDLAKARDEGEFDYFFDKPAIDKNLLKNQKHFSSLIKLLESLSKDDFIAEKIKTAIWDYASIQGRGEVLWPMRTALTGKERSPDPFTIAEIIGKEETLQRLNHAKDLL